MSRKIYLIQDDDSLLEMAEEPYDSEDILQTLLERYPDLLAGEQMDSEEPRRWMLVSREIGVPGERDGPNRWSLDHLFLDQDGVPTLVEVKRSSDSRIRREVVGQLLDYAANAVVYWPVQEIRTRFEAVCDSRGDDAAALIQQLLDFPDEGPPDVDEFWRRVKTHLQAGRVRLVFVADDIPSELRRIVEFLNEQMDPAEVLAVEVRQYAGQGLQTLVPQVVGQTAEAQQRKSAGSRQKHKWDETSFFAEFEENNGSEETVVARRILAWGKDRATYIWWGEGARTGSFVATVMHEESKHQLFAVYTYGALEIYFQWYQYKAPFSDEGMRRKLLRRLNEIPGIDLPEDVITRRPNIPMSLLTDEAKLRQLLEVFDWVVTEIRAS